MDWNKFVSCLSAEDSLELYKALKAHSSADQFTSEECEMIIRGNTIGAIKSVKNRLGLSLLEARNLVQSFRV